MASGAIVPAVEPEVPKVPMDYTWAKRLGLVRKPAAFISTISDDRGEELKYAGMPITEVFSEDIGVGGVLSLLWFRRRLPTVRALAAARVLAHVRIPVAYLVPAPPLATPPVLVHPWMRPFRPPLRPPCL